VSSYVSIIPGDLARIINTAYIGVTGRWSIERGEGALVVNEAVHLSGAVIIISGDLA
jgi:hypothetical protein